MTQPAQALHRSAAGEIQIAALRGGAVKGAGRRDNLIELTRRQLKPSPQDYIRVYDPRFGSAARE